MSIIQSIRDKYARVAVVAIALALVGFILTDYFSGRGGNTGGGGRNTVGVVNGTKINTEEFARKVQQTEEMMKQQGYPANATTSQMATEQTWNGEVNRIVLAGEFKKLGMRIEKKELGDILYGPNAPQDLKQQLTDPNTGVFDPVLAKQQVDQMLKSKQTPQDQKDRFNNYVYQLEQQRMTEKFVSMLSNSVNYPRWYVEKQNADNSLMAKVSMVKEVYASIPDSTIKLEDKEISDYINKHKEEYKQLESRSINYVTFSAAPSAADSLAAKNRVLALKAEFDTTDNVEQLLLREGVNNFYNGYISGKSIQIGVKDSIFRLATGGVYGPYLDGGSWVMAKKIDAKPSPDTVKIRHILISTESRDTATAYKLADSIRLAIAKGSNFDSLAAKFSDDGTKDKGGIYEGVYSGQMVPPFNDFIFLNPVGSKAVVKTEFGYHYTEILEQKGSTIAYKIAQLPKEIYASEETITEALNKASQFAGESRDQKSFDANFEKTLKPQNYIKGIAPEIKPNDAQVQGVGVSRLFVKNIYKAELGETMNPELVNDSYVVAIVTEINKEGTMPVAKARTLVEPMLKNKKKAEVLKQKLGSITTLEAASAAWGGKPIETVDSLRLNSRSNSPALGYEPRVSGAAFNPANKGKVIPEAIAGISGVYVVRVDNISATPSTEGSVADQRKSMSMQKKMELSNPQSPAHPAFILKNAATVRDKRAEIY